MIIIGHRGAAGLAPENTISAFQRAIDLGVDAIEMDVLLSSDGEVMVYHDFFLKPEITRSPDGKWIDEKSRKSILSQAFSVLKTYDVGRIDPLSGYFRRYPHQEPRDGERIPSLREVIHLLKNHKNSGTELWIEIKTSPEKPDLTPPPDKVVETVYQILSEEKVVQQSRLLSFDWRALSYSHEAHPQLPLIFLSHPGIDLKNIKSKASGTFLWTSGIHLDEYYGSIPKAVHQAGGSAWGPLFNQLNPEDVIESHHLGILVFTWAPDDPADMERMIEMNVDGIITNRPDILMSLI
jgi:glycerophosphoryl diester phosphodiesterase